MGTADVEKILDDAETWKTEALKVLKKQKNGKETLEQLLEKVRVSARFCMEKLRGPHWIEDLETRTCTFDLTRAITAELAREENSKLAQCQSNSSNSYCVCRM